MSLENDFQRKIPGVISDSIINSWLYFRVGHGIASTKTRCLYCSAESELELPRSELPLKGVDTTRIIIISDTHGQHESLGAIPDGDIFIHCGDIMMSAYLRTKRGQVEKLKSFNTWLSSVPCSRKIVIAGNHENVAPIIGKKEMASLISNAEYLENTSVEVESLRIFGSPLSTGRSRNNAFQHSEFKNATYESVEKCGFTDILVTHGPCQEIRHKLRPWLHCWGHQHRSHGIIRESGCISVCASIMDHRYRPLNLPIVIDISKASIINNRKIQSILARTSESPDCD